MIGHYEDRGSTRYHIFPNAMPTQEDLLAVIATAPAADLTAMKTASLLTPERGYEVTGFVVTSKHGELGIIDKSAVRWLTQAEMWWLMHDSAQIGKSLMTATQDTP